MISVTTDFTEATLSVKSSLLLAKTKGHLHVHVHYDLAQLLCLAIHLILSDD